jgi:dTDP-6-deoxy-L-talose 4-dehydrogenase (NAD+)
MYKKILITGSTGFIGREILTQIKGKDVSALCLYRKKKNNIKNRNITWIKSSLILSKKNSKIISDFSPEVVFHLAWYKIPNFNKKNCFQNFWLTSRFLSQISKIDSVKKIIISGSCFEYYSKSGKKKETAKLNFTDNFPSTKNILYKLALFLCKKRGIKLAWFRIFYAYGKHQRKDSLIPYMIKSIKNKKIIYLNNPNLKLDYINVEDIAKFFLKTLSINFNSGVFNLGTGRSYTPITILKKISYLLGLNHKKLKLNYFKESDKNEFNYFEACMKKTSQTFKIKKFKTLDDGLKKLLK